MLMQNMRRALKGTMQHAKLSRTPLFRKYRHCS